jgi:hypothetical protein
MKVDNTADISDQIIIMHQMMTEIHLDDPEVHRLADRVIASLRDMVAIGMNIFLLSMVGESFISEAEEETINEFHQWASHITDALDSR